MYQLFLLAILLVLTAASPPPSAGRLRELVRQGAPTVLVVEEVDRLMTTRPGCATAGELVEILPEALAAQGGARVLLRAVRHLKNLGCSDGEGARLEALLRRWTGELGILDAYLGLAGALEVSTPPASPAVYDARLRVRTGFRAVGGLRASLSPSGRYLAVGSLLEGGSITVWDLHTGYEQRSLAQGLTFLSAFLSEETLLVAGLGGISLWDFTTDRQMVLAPAFLEFPTFLAVSPDRRFVALNERRGHLRVFRVTAPDGGPIGLEAYASLTGERVQTGLFTGDGHLLLGTSDSYLLDFDLERRQVTTARFVGSTEDIPTEMNGDLSLEALRVLEGGLSGVRHITVSSDATRLAVTTNSGVVLLTRAPGELKREHDLLAEPHYRKALFVGDELVVWSHQAAFLLAAGDSPRNLRPGPGEIRSASWAEVLEGSTALFVGLDGYVIYDFERRAAHPRSVPAAPPDFGLGTRLLDDGRLLMYSPEEGLQEANLWDMRKAVANDEPAPLPAIYRGGLLGTSPPAYLQGLGAYGEDLYWIEFHEGRPFLVVLSRSGLRPLRRVSYHPLPTTVEPMPSSWKSQEAVAEMMAPFRTSSSASIPARLNIDLEGLTKGPLADVLHTLKGYERVAFDGTTVVVATEAGVEVLPVAGSEAWRIPRRGLGCKVAFHPGRSGLLVVWGEDGALEAWDLSEHRRLWSAALPPEPPRRLLFDQTGSLLALASREGIAAVDSDSGHIRFQHRFGPGSNIFGLAVDAASNQLLVTGDLGGRDLALADTSSGEIRTFLVGGTFGLFGQAAFWRTQNGGRPGILEVNYSNSELGLYRVEGDKIEKTLTLAFFDGGEAVVFDPANRFWSSLEGGRHVAVDYGPYVGSLDQLSDRSEFRNSKALLAALDGEPVPPPPPPPPIPPQVFLLGGGLSPFTRRVLDDGHLTVRLAVQSATPIRDLRIDVNGVRHQTVPVNAPQELEVRVNGLGSGYNEISFLAVDTADSTSLPATFPVLVRASEEPPPRLFFLGIGAGDVNLQGIPGQNARALAHRFAALPRGIVWSAVDAQTLVGSEATFDRIRAALGKVSDASGARDLLVLYLAGHGQRAATSGSWAFVTSEGELPLADLGEWLRQVPARVLLLLDTCYAGELDPLAPAGHDSLTARLLARRDAGIAVLAASKSWQRTWAWPESGKSIFAAALEQAFEPGADLDSNGVVSLREFQLVVGMHAESFVWNKFRKQMDHLRKLAGEKFRLSVRDPQANMALPHDLELWNIFQYPHRPWLYGLESFGDIPLLPVSQGRSQGERTLKP